MYWMVAKFTPTTTPSKTKPRPLEWFYISSYQFPRASFLPVKTRHHLALSSCAEEFSITSPVSTWQVTTRIDPSANAEARAPSRYSRAGITACSMSRAVHIRSVKTTRNTSPTSSWPSRGKMSPVCPSRARGHVETISGIYRCRTRYLSRQRQPIEIG